MNVGKARLERGDDFRGVVDRERGLRDVSETLRIARHEGAHLIDRFHQRDGAGGKLPDRSHHLGMAGVADQQDVAAALVMDLGFPVNLGDQRTGGVECEEIARFRLRRHGLRNAMRGKDHRRCGIGDFVELFDEDGALGLEAFHHVTVVHDLVAHIDRRAVPGERLLDGVDGAHDAGAKAARRAQQYFKRRLYCGRGRCAGIHSGTRFGHGAPDMGPCAASVKRAQRAEQRAFCSRRSRFPLVPAPGTRSELSDCDAVRWRFSWGPESADPANKHPRMRLRKLALHVKDARERAYAAGMSGRSCAFHRISENHAS